MNRMILSGAVLGLTASVGMAQVVSFTGDVSASAEMTGANFSGSLEYVHVAGEIGRLSIELTNITPLNVSGFLTGFIFRSDASSNSIDAMLDFADPASFLNTGPQLGGGFGMFEGGAALFGSFLGGGSPVGGLANGQSGTFDFFISSDSAATLTSADFIGTSESPGLLVRFRGLSGGGSDMVPVPAPGGLALLGMGGLGGLGGLLATRRRR